MTAIVGLSLVSSIAIAKVIALAPSKDNTLYQDAIGALSNGSGAGLFVGQNAVGGFARRALLAFDLTGHIPPGSRIHSATLTLHTSETSSGRERVALHRVLAQWGEGGSIADEGAGGGQGAPAASGDATWIHRMYPDRAWTTPGGDYDPSVLATCEVNDVGFYTWGATERMTEDIQRWVDNPPGNFGWLLIGQELGTQTSKRFDSREAAEVPSRPMLVLHFTPPGSEAGPLEGDLNGDLQVDFLDMAILAGQWRADATIPMDPGIVTIAGWGEFSYDPMQVRTLRPDIFRPGHFSVFDVLAYLDRQGMIDMVYHFDASMATHVIDSINGTENWWYRAHYEGEGLADVAARMDLYPWKEGMTIRIEPVDEPQLDQIHASFASETARWTAYGGRMQIPEVTIASKSFKLVFLDVAVQPHNLRPDTFQRDVITAIDVILSLADQGKITCDLRWSDPTGTSARDGSFDFRQIGADVVSDQTILECEAGVDRSFGAANRVSLPADWRVLVSPSYVEWRWIQGD